MSVCAISRRSFNCKKGKISLQGPKTINQCVHSCSIIEEDSVYLRMQILEFVKCTDYKAAMRVILSRARWIHLNGV